MASQNHNPKVVTRFAPSPTGMLHIGSARTALFNWAFARHHHGQFLLRIEDTDRERSTDQAITAIIDGLKWLGISWDSSPVMQSKRQARHQQIADQLLANGKAYRCYASSAQLAEMREDARRSGNKQSYNNLWRDRDPAQAPPEVKPAIRLATPLSGETIISDQVQGEVRFANQDIDDMVLMRSDGTPTYMLAVVVDDHDMGVTDIIRGDDHLTNMARQAQIYQALGWSLPRFAHIPLIHDEDGNKLSKRHNAPGIENYRDMGYLADAMVNYLARLGWSHGDDEVFNRQQLIDWFTITNIGKSPARLDFAKLDNLNSIYIRNRTPQQILSDLKGLAAETNDDQAYLARLTDELEIKLLDIMPELQIRAKNLRQIMESSAFIFSQRPIELADEAKNILNQAETTLILKALHTELSAINSWDKASVETAIRDYARANDIKLGRLIPPLRFALTGRPSSVSIFAMLVALGRKECLARIADQCEYRYC